jgi:UDPglucose--hexose-1-phosphate uridylyltransferase
LEKQVEMFNSPHRRFNPLTREWVLVSPQRTARPWLGQVEKSQPPEIPSYDPTCPLCPGNKRATGAVNDKYTSTFVFTNDFPALMLDTERATPHPKNELMKAEVETGTCRVICFSPRHDLTLPDLSLADASQVVRTWAQQTLEISSLPEIQYVQVFENKGAMMGCSNPHPHSQVWATAHIPNEPAKELISQQEYYRVHSSPLLLAYLAQELKSPERIIASNASFTVLVPFWAIWPFEVMVIANQPVSRLTELSDAQVTDLAAIFLDITRRYDGLFGVSFPYSMGFHQSPFDGEDHPEWVLHAHFYPPLLRSATIRKFMVGYELMAMPQRDLTPESAAERIRSIQIKEVK